MTVTEMSLDRVGADDGDRDVIGRGGERSDAV